jgi:hypothetical protein
VSDAIFPSQIYGLKQNIPRTSEFATVVQKGDDPGNTMRIARCSNPVYHWEFTYEQLFDDFTNPNYTYSELQTLLGFCLSMQGQRRTFLLKDSNDNTVGPALNPDGSPNLQAQLQIVTDGLGNFFSPIQRNVGGQFYEDITDLGPGGITVWDNGAAKFGPPHGSPDYLIIGPGFSGPGYSFAGLGLAWTIEPAGPVTAQFDYYFRVRFEKDTAEFEQFLRGLWTYGGTESIKGSTLQLITERRKS